MMTHFSFSKHKVSPKLKSKTLNMHRVTHYLEASQHLMNNSFLHIFFESPKQWKKGKRERKPEREIYSTSNESSRHEHKPQTTKWALEQWSQEDTATQSHLWTPGRQHTSHAGENDHALTWLKTWEQGHCTYGLDMLRTKGRQQMWDKNLKTCSNNFQSKHLSKAMPCL